MIIQKENFLLEEDFNTLSNYALTTNDWEKTPNNPLWNERCINPSSIKTKEVLNVLKHTSVKMSNEIFNSFSIDKEIYPSLLGFAKTSRGETGSPHSDSTGNNGEDNGTSYRKFSALIYLGGTFSGGNLFFPNQDKTIIPQPNLLVMFPSTYEYMHGVTEIFSGVRYSLTSFWSYDYSMSHPQQILDRI